MTNLIIIGKIEITKFKEGKMKEEKPKASKNLWARFTNLFKDRCPKCGHILKRSTVSVRNEKGKIVPWKICPNCDYKQ